MKAKKVKVGGRKASPCETVIRGKWRATARYASNGRTNLVPRRFVNNRGIREIDDSRLERRIIGLLRSGYEVRLFGGSIRLYHCVDKEFRTMYVAASTLADSRMRSCVHDIAFDFVRKDGTHDRQDVVDMEFDRRQAKDELIHITPDTIGECPTCGTQFRIGKILK